MDTNLIIEEKPAFTLAGIGRDFSKENCFSEIPKYWDEFMSENSAPIKGRFGICIDKEPHLCYLIADIYYPWISMFPNIESVTFESGLWAMFSTDGSLPDSLQKVTTYVWKEWIPGNKEYELRAGYNIEFYPHDV